MLTRVFADRSTDPPGCRFTGTDHLKAVRPHHHGVIAKIGLTTIQDEIKDVLTFGDSRPRLRKSRVVRPLCGPRLFGRRILPYRSSLMRRTQAVQSTAAAGVTLDRY